MHLEWNPAWSNFLSGLASALLRNDAYHPPGLVLEGLRFKLQSMYPCVLSNHIPNEKDWCGRTVSPQMQQNIPNHQLISTIEMCHCTKASSLSILAACRTQLQGSHRSKSLNLKSVFRHRRHQQQTTISLQCAKSRTQSHALSWLLGEKNSATISIYGSAFRR